MIFRSSIIIAALAWSNPALSQSVTLTEGRGRPITIGIGESFGSELTQTSIEPQVLVDEFKRLCLPDPVGASKRFEGSPLSLRYSEVIFPPNGKRAEVRVPRWRGQSAELTIWENIYGDLKGQFIIINERAYQVTGTYGPFRASNNQCNLVVNLPNFTQIIKLSEALSKTFGLEGKLVVKDNYADGHWQVGTTLINFTAPKTKYGRYPIHLSVQIAQKGSK